MKKKLLFFLSLWTLCVFTTTAVADEVDYTPYIANAGFDEDLTFNADGSYKDGTVPNEETEALSSRSWSYINPDGSYFAHSDSRSVGWKGSDGRTWATNGYVAQIKGWEYTRTDYPACEWVFFGVLPYDLGETAIPIADDGTTYQCVPATKPETDNGDDNVGALFFRAGWGGECSYKQDVVLPLGKYRLEYWTINVNPNSTAASKDITNVKCKDSVFEDISGNDISSTEWTKHYIDFDASSDVTIEFGYKSANSGSGGQIYVFVDGVKLYRIDGDDNTDDSVEIEPGDDCSRFIMNATFDVIGDFTGWSGTKFTAGGVMSTCAEHYSRNYNTYQDVSIDLPVGIYKVGVKGFYRAGGTDNDWNTKDDPTFRHAKLYAVSGEDSLYTAIPAFSSYAQDSAVGAPNEVQYAGYYLPNSMADFTAYKEAGLIDEVSVLIPVKNNKLRIGVVNTPNITNDWTIVDDFTLEYYGNTVEAYYLWRNQMLATVPSLDNIITDGTLYTESYKTAFEAVIETAKTSADAAAITAAIKAINPALDSLQANITAYKNYQAKLEEAQKTLLNDGLDGYAEPVMLLMDYFGSNGGPGDDDRFPNGGAIYIIENCPLSTADLVAETEVLTKWIQVANTCIETGGDCTDMLVNPDFTDGKTGWTTGSGCNPAFAWGVAEIYGDSHGQVDISQTLTGVKPGIYSISVQAFERPAQNGSYDGTEEPKVFLYMGDLETPVQNITTDLGEEPAQSYDYLWTSPDGSRSGYIPNSMEGANLAFAAGRYVQKCYGIVGDDGIMKIGLTSHGVVPHWVLFDNFKLTYMGEDVDAMAQVLENHFSKVQAYIDNHGVEMTTAAVIALEEAIANADMSVESGDYDAMAASIKDLNTALNDAKGNVAALSEFISAIDALDIALMEYELTATEEAIINACTAMEKIGDEAYLEFTTEELKAATEEMKYATVALKIPNTVVDASDENPVDLTSVIANACFDEGANVGWSFTKNGGNGPEISNGYDGPGFEFWNSSAASLQFNLYQEVIALPAGKYTVAADLANSYNGQTPGTNGGRGILYADVVVGTDTTTYSVAVEPQTEDCTAKWNNYEVTFDVPADAKVIVGTKSHGVMDARWYMGDSFTLTYYGTESSKPNTGDETVTDDFAWQGTWKVKAGEIISIDDGDYPTEFDMEVVYEAGWDMYVVTKFYGKDVAGFNSGGIELTPSSSKPYSATIAGGGYVGGSYPNYLKLYDMNGKDSPIEIFINEDGSMTLSPFCIMNYNFDTGETSIAAYYSSCTAQKGVNEEGGDDNTGDDDKDDDIVVDGNDYTPYILNAGFDKDLTFNADGSYKDGTVPNEETEALSSRSWSYINPDGSYFAHTDSRSVSWKGSDGRTWATNGYVAAIKGWECTRIDYPACEWVFFGVLPYDLGETAIPVADDGTTYQCVPATKPETDNGDDNVGALFLRAGWGGECSYKQNVTLPVGRYRLEYWSINVNPNSTSIATDLTKVVCNNFAFMDESGNDLSSTEWTKHYIDFDASSDVTIEFGYKAANSGSGTQIYAFIDGVKLYKLEDADNTVKGEDCTDLIVNAKFADGFNGWTCKSGGLGGLKDVMPTAEVYENVVDVYQEIEGLTPGLYAVSVQAFERPAANGEYDGSEEPKAYVFINEAQAPVMNILADAMPEDKAVDKENCYITQTTGGWPYDYGYYMEDGSVRYIPNSMDGASYAFKGERYVNTCYGIVGEDGKMKLGLTSNGQTVHWALFANFKLAYLGEDTDIVSEILQKQIESAWQCYEREMTEPVMFALEEAIMIAEDAMGIGDYGYMNEALAGLNNAIADAERNANIFEECYLVVDMLDIAICDYESSATEDALARALTVLDVWVNGEHYVFTTEELEGMIAEMKYATAAVKVPYDVLDASDDNPVDVTTVIANACFDEGANVGWSFTKNGGNGPVYANGYDGPGFEFWNSSAASLQFNLYQEVIALPAGKYTVAADLANSYNGQTPGTNGGRGILYADVVVGTDTTTYSVAVGPQTEDCTAKWNNYEVTFDVPADAKVIVGTKSHGVMDARWYMGDSFTLTYYGAESSRPNTGNSAVIGKYSVIEVEAERAVGLGYNFDDVAVDMDSICGLLGISDISEARVWGVNATNLSYVRNAMQTYDGWRNMNGDFTYWSNNAAICYQYDADKAQFGLCTHPDMEPGFGAVVPAYWAFTHNSDTVLVKTTIKFETLESGLSLTIHVDEPGTLAEKILAETANYTDVKHLILSGTLNDDDINIIQNRLTSLRTIDLSGLNMKAIPDYMFSGNNSLCKVVLPEGLESIGYAAFQNCSKLEGIVLPTTLKTIGSNAFYGCDKLQSIVIPEGVTTVGSYAFYGCGSLYTMEWPSTATTISDYAFYNTALLEIVIPEGVTAIGNSAFDHCQNITSIVCPSTLKRIGTNAFYNCNSLAMVEFNEGLETIGSYAFGYCALTDITLPSTLRYCDKPFEGCYNVSTVTSKSLVPPMLNDGCDIFASDWNGMDLSAIILYVPEWSAIKYRATIGWDVYGTVVPIENFLPENIVVSDKFKFTLPDSLPSDYKPNLTVSYVEGDWVFGSLELKGNSMLSVDKYEMTYDFNTDYNNGYWDDAKPYHTALINKANMRADSVVVTIYNHNDVWTFISFPYDVKVSDIVPVYENTNYVIRKYSGMDRANGNFGNTWVGMTGDSILRAGEGYIWQSSRCDNNDVWQNWSGFHVPAMDNGNKNMIFANSDREITLNEYQSEFSHNRSWNLVGNPYPSYYDIRYMDFTAPITVWSSRNATYYAYSPVDDEFILSPGEAFFVQRPVDLGTITFVAEGRQTDRVVRELGAEAKRLTDATNERQVFNLVLEGNEKSDRTRFVINANAACDYDMSMDANKFMSTDASVPQLYTIEGNVHFAINERPMGSGNISLGAYFGCKGVYTIALNTKVQGLNVVLIDNLTGVETDLMNDSYTFDAESGVAEGRFEIRLSDNDGATGIDGANANASVKAVDGQIVVDLSASAYIEVYKVDGTRVAATAAASATFDVEPGVYMVKVQNAVHKVSVAR